MHQFYSATPPQVPLSWYALWEGPDDPVLYLRSLVAKALALGVWEEKGRGNTLLQGAELDLSELFHPNTFFNALRQQTARYADNVCFYFVFIWCLLFVLHLYSVLYLLFVLHLLFVCPSVCLRLLKCSMDNLKFVCSWLSGGIAGATLSVKVRFVV